MTILQAPNGLEAQVQWLVDRACIAELLAEYARSLDAKDFDATQECFTSDGVMELPFGSIPAVQLAGAARAALGCFEATQHINVTHQINIQGDRAKIRQSCIAIHVHHANETDHHGDIGGEYDMEAVRVPGGWRFSRVREDTIWTSGSGYPGSADHSARLQASDQWNFNP